MNILLVDDEQFQIDTIKRGIRIHGHQVNSARSGEEALAYLEEHPDETTLVITDYFMPGMNGITLIKSIRERYGDLPIILMTAFGDKNLLIEALQNGCDNYLDKPFKPNDIVSQIDEIQMQREKRKRRGPQKELRTSQGIKENQSSGQNLIPMPIRHQEQTPQIVETNTEAIVEAAKLVEAPKQIMVETEVQPNQDMELALIEEENPLIKLGGRLHLAVPLVKVVFPVFIFLLTGLTMFFLLVAPMFK
jgi:CheY-like chemotaxis protein